MLAQRVADTPGEPETAILIDTSPDLRWQLAAAEARRLDAVLYTHDHADQTHGIDDLRVFFLTSRRRTPCYMDAATRRTLTDRFDYIFESKTGYPAICEARDLPAYDAWWEIEGPSGAIPILHFDQDHGGVRSVGYRLGPIGYCSDVVDLPPGAMAALAGVEVFIVDALRYTPHPTHAHLDRALEWIEALKPARGVLTNMHSDLDYATLTTRLPPGVEAAHDGMVIEAGV